MTSVHTAEKQHYSDIILTVLYWDMLRYLSQSAEQGRCFETVWIFSAAAKKNIQYGNWAILLEQYCTVLYDSCEYLNSQNNI